MIDVWPQLKPTYATVAEAEKAIADAGFVRDAQRHVWVKGANTAKVVRTLDDDFNLRFSIGWG